MEIGWTDVGSGAADNVYLGETNVSVAYLVSLVVFFVTWELALDL
jgi:hypothetical protein